MTGFAVDRRLGCADAEAGGTPAAPPPPPAPVTHTYVTVEHYSIGEIKNRLREGAMEKLKSAGAFERLDNRGRKLLSHCSLVAVLDAILALAAPGEDGELAATIEPGAIEAAIARSRGPVQRSVQALVECGACRRVRHRDACELIFSSEQWRARGSAAADDSGKHAGMCSENMPACKHAGARSENMPACKHAGARSENMPACKQPEHPPETGAGAGGDAISCFSSYSLAAAAATVPPGKKTDDPREEPEAVRLLMAGIEGYKGLSLKRARKAAKLNPQLTPRGIWLRFVKARQYGYHHGGLEELLRTSDEDFTPPETPEEIWRQTLNAMEPHERDKTLEMQRWKSILQAAAPDAIMREVYRVLEEMQPQAREHPDIAKLYERLNRACTPSAVLSDPEWIRTLGLRADRKRKPTDERSVQRGQLSFPF